MKKVLLIFLILFLSIAGYGLWSYARQVFWDAAAPLSGKAMETVSEPAAKKVQDVAVCDVMSGLPFSVSYGEVMLSGPAGSVDAAMRIVVSGVDSGMPPLDAGMVNVTAGHACYRFLPHGTRFGKEVHLTMGYDTARIPRGHSYKEIRTYYYDEQQRHWKPLPYDSVSTERGEVYSRTDHFTDMINAIISYPELPEGTSYTPTMLQEMEAAHPASGITLMEAPQAGSEGTATMHYPIILPQGRNGMQPDLNISYNSESGNGLLGMGWDMQVPAVSVDSKWGVPRYDTAYETECYLLNGQELLPSPHYLAAWEARNQAEKVFYPRTETSFDSITRKGTAPGNYFWEVRDKSGKKYYYGSYDGQHRQDSVLLKDARGNIAYWPLCRVEDMDGNLVMYYYHVEQQYSGTTYLGKQLWLESIRYTGNAKTGDTGIYTVFFSGEHCKETIRTRGDEISHPEDDCQCPDMFLKIHKYKIVEGSQKPLVGIRFDLRDNTTGSENTYSTDGHGDVTIPILDCNHEFTLNEWFYSGYCKILRNFQFRIVKEDGICRFEIINHGNHPETVNINNDSPNSLELDIENIPCGGGSGTGDSIYSARPHLPDNVYACMSPCDCDEEYHEDLRTDARWGFLHSGKNKLRRIVVYSGDSLVRSYSFCYGADVFGRAQLRKIRQWNADCSGEPWDHDLSYYDDVNGQLYVSDSVTVSNPASSIRISEKSCKNKELNLISRKLQITPSLLGSSRTWNAGIGGGFNIGLGKNVMNQEVTLELNLGGGGNWGKGLSTLTDVNGDGLPDAVYIRKDSVHYCLQTADRQFGNEQYLGVKRFLKDYSTNIHESIGANCVAHGSLGSEQSKHVTNVYFTDLNGDGLLDIVDKGQVKTVMQGYKPPVITVDTNCSEISICQGEAYQADEIVLPDLDYEEEHPLPELQPYDMVRFFVNQVCDRAMQIYAPVQFLPLGQGADSLEKDTVILSIEYYDTSRSFVVQQKMLTSDDLSLDWSGPLLTSGNPNLTNEARDFFFQGVNTCYYPTSECVFFFRVHPYNGRPIRHLLSWDPQIKYRNSCNSTEDVYSPHNLSAGAQLLQSDGTFYCPFNGKLHIKYEQTLNSTTLPTGQNISYTYSLSYNNVIIANHQLDENNSTIQYDTVLSVDTGVVLTFSVRSNDIWENMHLNQWRPNVYYDSICIDNVMTKVLDYEENSSDTFKYFNYYPVPKYDISDQLFYCVYHSPSVANENMFELQANTTLNILIDFQNQVINGRYTLYLVGDQGVLYRCTGYVNSTNISETASISNGYNGPLWLECVFDGIPATSLSYNSFIDGFNCICVIYDSSKRVSHPLHKSMYGQWGQFQYKNENNENLIDTNFFAKCGKQDTTRLKSLISQMMFDSTQFAQYDTTQYSLWRNEVTDIFKLLPLTANGETRRYEGVFPNSFIQDAIIGIGYLPDMTEWLSDDEDEDLPAEPVVSNELRNSVLQDVSTRGRASRSGGKGCLLNKVSRSLNFNGNWSAMGMGQSASRSITYTTNDVMDLNGDGYPDIIHDGMVYYTKHKGVNWDFSSTSSIFSENNHLSKNYSIGNNFSAEPVKTVIVPNIRNKGMRTVIDGMPDISGGNTVSEDRVEHTLADINGDGLPDLIYRNNKVKINTGYGFLPEKDWAGLSEIGVSTGTLQNVGVGDGTTLFAGASTDPKQPLSEWHASISGGLSLNKAQNEQITILLDINGDGLPDMVRKNYDNRIRYRLNTGIAFDSTWHTWYRQTLQDWSTSLTIGGNAALTGGITYMGIKLCGSVAVNASYTKNSERVQFTDFDGDGLPDLLQENNNSLHVRYARLGRTGLLQTVTNPLGGSIMLDYEMTDANVYHPRRWVMKEVKLSDGLPGDGADTLTTRYGYQYGYYDHAERRFLGFAKVSTFEINTNGDTLRTTERFFANNNVLLAGQILAEVLYDSLHRRYVQTTNQISLDTLDTVGGAARVFPKLNATRTCYFEGLNYAPITRTQTFAYENTYGNLVRQSESSTDQAKITANIFYHAQYNGNYCVNRVSRVDLRNGANVLLRRRTTDLDAMGHFTAIHDYHDSTHCLTTRMEYDTCGNITVLRSPNTTTYFAYDSIANTYPAAVTDTFGIASYMQDYDYRFGVPRTIVDRAGNRMEYTLDAWGRTLTIRGPKEIAANQPYTIRHSYFGKDSLKAYASSLTEHYDPQHPGNSIKVRTYCDGLGRIVQTRKEAAVNGVEKFVVSGLQQYDALGRAIKTYYPTEAVLSDTACAFVAGGIPPATVVYDVLDRPLLQTAPDGSSSTFLYGFDGSHLGKMLFKTTTTDANHHSSTELKDVNGTPWAVKAAGQPFVYFDYNAAGDNIRVYSSIANDWERIYAYDLLGRRLTYTEGELAETLTYNGNNLASYQQRWIEGSQHRTKNIYYHYTAHRLDSVSYDDALSTVYHYNAYGQPDSVYDESGVMCYEYGNMGEVTKETRIYALPFLPQPLALSTLFEYDSWGRILNITYPDNEIVNYDYDLGGQLERMYNNSSYNYLDNIIYDRFGAKTSQDYGNGIVTQYTYNDTTRRLTAIATSNGSLINYTYDLVGNVTQVNSSCPWLPNQSFTETFSYDSTDQLVSANEAQSYQLAVNYGNWGKIMQYDLTQTDMLNNATSQISRSLTYPSHANNVGNSQTPFAPTMQNGDEDVFFTFGINGSLRKREVQTPSPHIEYYLFNSQGNLKAYSDDVMSFAYYGYNAANTRTYKISLYNTNLWINGQQQPLHLQLQQAMFYPNTYLNFDAFGNYTKHYYNGTERIASRLGDNSINIALDNSEHLEPYRLQLEDYFKEDIQDLISELTQIDMPAVADALSLQPTGTSNDVFYYHINHLGNTAFVTDNNATITQGFLYAPFGEITTEYNVNFGNNTIPKYAFNAKELDEETGFYYYEARYYAPPVFTSRDPLFEKYFWMSPYAYCANNPVKYVDPSGKDFDPTQEKIYIEPMKNDIKTKISQKIVMRDRYEVGSEEYNRLNDHITQLSNALTEIQDLKDDEKNLYFLTFGDISFNKDAGGDYADAAGSLTYGGMNDKGQNIININMAEKYAGTSGSMLHEFKHAHQYFLGELGFIIKNNGQIESTNNRELEREANYRGDVYDYSITKSYRNYKLQGYKNLENEFKGNPGEYRRYAANNGWKYIGNR